VGYRRTVHLVSGPPMIESIIGTLGRPRRGLGECDESGPVPEIEWIVDDVMMMYPGSETVFSG